MQKAGLTAAVLFLLISLSIAQDKGANQMLKYSVLYSDSKDVTHFKDQYYLWNDTGEGYSTTPFEDAKQIGFLLIHAGEHFDWHPAPRKQYIMVMDGIMEVEAGDGEKRKFAPGSILLVTDTKSRGHRTNNIGSKPITAVWVPVP